MYTIYLSTTVILKTVSLLYMYSLPFSIFKLTGKTRNKNYTPSNEKHLSHMFLYYVRSM